MAKLPKTLRDDQSGTVTIEFLLTFPLIVGWLFLSFTMFDAYRSSANTSKAIYTISDNLSRLEEVAQADLDDMYLLLDELLPFSPDDKWLRVTSITFDEDLDDYVLHWSYISKPVDDPTLPLTQETLPTALLPAVKDSDSVLLVEANVPYDPVVSTLPFLDTIGFTSLVFEPRSIVRPRFIAKVVCTDCTI